MSKLPRSVASATILALGCGALLSACAQPAKPNGGLQIQVTGLPPGLHPTISVKGEGHAWDVVGVQKWLRLPVGEYQVVASPSVTDGWTYRPPSLRQEIDVSRHGTEKVTEGYQLWPSSETPNATWSNASSTTPDAGNTTASNLSCVSKSFCMAVGTDGASTGNGDYYQ